jgi:hypothetical protein
LSAGLLSSDFALLALVSDLPSLGLALPVVLSAASERAAVGGLSSRDEVELDRLVVSRRELVVLSDGGELLERCEPDDCDE